MGALPAGGGASFLGGLPARGVPPSGGCLPLGGGASLPGGCLLPGGWGGLLDGTPPPVNRMTNRCKNITLPQTSFAGGKNAQSISQRLNFMLGVDSLNGLTMCPIILWPGSFLCLNL